MIRLASFVVIKMADRKELEIDGKPLSSLRVVDLKMELEKRGMSKSGSKKELSDRLKMQLQLEKLQESASTDEGHVPNLRLQDDEIAEHNDIIKDYLAKQQQVYEMQKEAIRRVELEQRVRDSEASAGDTSQEEEDFEHNQTEANEPRGLDLTVTTQIEAAITDSIVKREVGNTCQEIEANDAVVDTLESESSKGEISPTAEPTTTTDVGSTEEPSTTSDVGPTDDPAMTSDVGPTEDPAVTSDAGPTEEPSTTSDAGSVEETNAADDARPTEEPNATIDAGLMHEHSTCFTEIHQSSAVSNEPSPVSDHSVIENPEMDSDEIAAAVSGIENSITTTDYIENQEQNATISTPTSVSEEIAERDEDISITADGNTVKETEQDEARGEAEVDSSPQKLEPTADDSVCIAKSLETLENEKILTTENEEATERVVTQMDVDQSRPAEQSTKIQVDTETVLVQEETPVTAKTEMPVPAEAEMPVTAEAEMPVTAETETPITIETETPITTETANSSKPIENPIRSPPRHRPKLKRRSDWGTASTSTMEGKEPPPATDNETTNIVLKDQEKDDQCNPSSSLEETATSITERRDEECTKDVTTVQSHHLKISNEKECPREMDSPDERRSEKTEEEDTRDGNNSQRSPSRDSSEYERPSRIRTRNRHSSSESSSSSKSSSGSQSRSRSSDSNSSLSDSRSPSGSRTPSPRNKKNVPFAEESMETCEDSASRPSPRPIPLEEKTETGEERMDVDETFVETVTEMEDASDCHQTKAAKEVENVKTPEGPTKISSRKISLSSSKDKKDKGGDGKESEVGVGNEGEKQQRKRRWGGSGVIAATDGKKVSLSISTDSLKGLIPDVKPLTVSNSGTSEPVLELSNDGRETSEPDNELSVKEEPAEPNTVPQQNVPSSKREAIIYRTVTQVVKDKSSEVVDKDPKKGKRIILRNSASVTLSEDKSTVRRSPSPARYPPSCIVHIRNLVRPFTLNQLKELLARTGTLIEGGFWIDKIKSKCYVTYESEDQAIATRQALHGVQWPSSNPKRLIVDYASQDELEFHRSLTDTPEVKRMVQTGATTSTKEWPPVRSPPPVSHRKTSMAADVEPPARQHRESRRSEHEKDREKDKKEQRHNSSRTVSSGARNEKSSSGKERDSERSKGRERETAPGLRQPPIREWDRDKIGEKSPGERARAARNRNRMSASRSRSRSRGGGLGSSGIGGVGDGGRSPPLVNEGYGRRERKRNRSREMDMRDRRDRKDRRKEEEEAPAKLLDDLFRKTKATPCIYWLPLTAEQINAKEEERRQRQVEREKRRQQEQAERDRNGNANLEPNKRSRERQEDGRNRRRSASPVRTRTRRR